MPKQTFFNLSEEKKSRLLEAAYAEFSKVSLEEASINVIVQQSDISRGSFYQYFEDKEDLYFYCLYLLRKDLKLKIEQCFIDEDGNLMPSIRQVFKQFYFHYLKSEYKDFYHHFFVDMSYRRSRNMFTNGPIKEKKHKHFLIFEELLPFINRDNLVFTTDEELLDFLQYVFQNIHWTISGVFLQNLPREKAIAIIDQRLSWLEHGIIKNNKEATSHD